MARIETDPNYTAPTFPRATAATDLFKKEDVQQLAAAMSTHDHSNGKGVAIPFASIPNGTITSAMIADGTIVAGDIADGAVTSAKILDGTVATIDLADGAVTNAKLASDTARANLLTNGGFRVWQRGNGPFTLGWTADRWQFGTGAGGSFSVSKVQNGAGPPGDPWAAMLQAIYTHGSVASSIFQPVMTTDTDLRGKTVTFACWIQSTVAATTGLRLVSDGTSAQDIFVPLAQANTWQRLTATINVPSNATLVYCQMQMGASCTASMTAAMLVVGSVAGDYAPLHPADDLARCQRYCARLDNSNGLVHSPGLATSPTNARGIAQWPVTMAVVPSVTVTGVSNINVVNSAGNGVLVTALTPDLLSVTGGRLNATTEAYLTAGAATYFTWTAAASILAEANP